MFGHLEPEICLGHFNPRALTTQRASLLISDPEIVSLFDHHTSDQGLGLKASSLGFSV